MIQSRKKVFSLVTIVALAVVITFLILQINNKHVDGNQYNHINLKFGDNFISYVIEDKDGMSFNIFGVQEVKNTNTSIKDLVSSIEFNNPNIDVIDYQVDEGIVYQGYKLFNIIVTTQVLTDKVETADQLLIQFGNEDVKSYAFGNLAIQNNISYQNQHIEPSGKYNVGYPSLSLNVSVKNKTNKDINLSEIYDLTEDISYEFNQSFNIPSQEKKQIQINNFNKKSEGNHDFMTITPILSYSLENSKYVYNMPGVVYGVLDSDADKIKKIIN